MELLQLNPPRLPSPLNHTSGYFVCEYCPVQLGTPTSPILLSNSDNDELSAKADDGWTEEHEQIAALYDSPINSNIAGLLFLPFPRSCFWHCSSAVRRAPRPSTNDGFAGAIISIGPETDRVLTKWKLPDDFIPHLRVLSQTVQSSHWKDMLHTADYGLTLKQASQVSDSMICNIKYGPGSAEIYMASPPLLYVLGSFSSGALGWKILQENGRILVHHPHWSCLYFVF